MRYPCIAMGEKVYLLGRSIHLDMDLSCSIGWWVSEIDLLDYHQQTHIQP